VCWTRDYWTRSNLWAEAMNTDDFYCLELWIHLSFNNVSEMEPFLLISSLIVHWANMAFQQWQHIKFLYNHHHHHHHYICTTVLIPLLQSYYRIIPKRKTLPLSLKIPMKMFKINWKYCKTFYLSCFTIFIYISASRPMAKGLMKIRELYAIYLD
jgi:hypothetical protein